MTDDAEHLARVDALLDRLEAMVDAGQSFPMSTLQGVEGGPTPAQTLFNLTESDPRLDDERRHRIDRVLAAMTARTTQPERPPHA